MQRQLIFNVQLLRFLAAAAVLFTHTFTLLLPQSPLSIVPWIGGVDVFFVISGFIMTWMTLGQFGSAHASRRFLLRRIIRIVPPYWFFTLLTIAVVVAAGGRIRNTTADGAQIATSLLFIPWPRIDGAFVPILAQGWTLNYEAFFYLAFAVAMLFRGGLPLLVGGFAALAIAHPFLPPPWFVLGYFSHPVILEFVAGIALAHAYISGLRLPAWASLLLIVAAIAWYAFCPTDAGSFTQPLRLGIPAALLASALVLAPEPPRLDPMRRALQAGGDASYTLYLSHTLTVNAVIALCGKLGMAAPWLVIGLALGAAIAFAVLFYFLVEAPVTSWLGRHMHARVSQGPATVAP